MIIPLIFIFFFRPPNKKFEDKVFIPQDHHPETNFVGLLIGPRYNLVSLYMYINLLGAGLLASKELCFIDYVVLGRLSETVSHVKLRRVVLNVVNITDVVKVVVW